MRPAFLSAGLSALLLASASALPFSVSLSKDDPALRCGAALSPALALGTPPPGTRSLAVVFWDQQPKKLTGRWLVYNLPVNTRQLPSQPAASPLVAGGTVGPNDLGQSGFVAPCDAGARDLYVDYYALSTARLPVPKGASFRQIHSLIHKYKLAEAKAHLKWVVK